MISALISFFGGSAFRMLWGEISSFITARQEHKHELERLRLQAEIDAAQHARNLEAIKLQHDLGAGSLRASTLRKRINAGRWGEVPGELRKWVRGGGRVLPGLVRRREAEASLI